MEIKRDFEEEEWVKEISGKQFRDCGMLWLVNSLLHLFGMAIIWEPETDELRAVITKYRGFNEEANDSGYKKITEYIRDNVNELIKDVESLKE